MSEPCPHCGSARSAGAVLCMRCLFDRALPTVAVGDELELGELIGEGGMGSVFRARDLRLQREVAVKMLNRSAVPDAAARLEREARTLALLQHPGIVSVYQVAHGGDQPYIAMELLGGGSLAAQLPLSPARVACIGAELCDALAYAHARGVVHRDLKPANVLFRDDGRAVLTDFGIARLQGADGASSGWTLTHDGTVAGTPEYMAPEARRGARPDPRMDIFSLGVVLYEALSGELPSGDFPRLPHRWDRVIRCALASDPTQRYADAAAFGRALRGLEGGAEEATALPSDEKSFMRAVAGMQTAASAVTLWALYLSITPRVISAAELQPLTMVVNRTLADGRIVSIARFEIWPTIIAVLSAGFAVGCYALLRRHWRLEGLERDVPDEPVPDSAFVLGLGVFNVLGFGVRLSLQAAGAGDAIAFVPVLGGISEAVTVYASWMTALELWRRRRPLYREWRLWAGLALSAVPPVVELGRYLRAFQP